MSDLPLNRGILYERSLYEKLKNENKIPDGIFPGGCSDNPDLVVIINNNHVPVEVKLSQSCDFGQIELRYNTESSRWIFGGTNEYIKSLYSKINILDEINTKWNLRPNKESINSDIFTWENAKEDYNNFKSFFIDVPKEFIYDFYQQKGINYIQIKKYGFYYLKNNSYNLDIPQFDPEVHARIRIKRRSSKFPDKYGFLIALKIKTKAEKSYKNLEYI